MGYLGKEPRKDGGSLTLGATLDTNGNEIVLDADADTSITADTDDQIDIRIAGADDFQFTANTFTAQSGSTIAAQALTATTITASGIVKTDDATEATSTTDGSLQTDGGLSVVKDAVFGDDVKLLSDSAVLSFGADSEVTLTHSADVGLLLKHTATADDKAINLILQTGETDIELNDVLGAIKFQAPDEGTGTDAILIAAQIHAVSEGNFSSSNNATALVFATGASEAATEKMRIDSTGRVGIGITTPRNTLDFGVTSNNDHVIALRDNNTSRTILGLTNGYGVRVGSPSDGTSSDNMFEVGEINASDGTTYQNTKFAVTYAGNASIDGGLIVNESGSSADFRVESDNNANIFTVDASHDRIGIGSVGQTNVGVAIDISPSASTLKVTNATDNYGSNNIWSVLGDNTNDDGCNLYAGYSANGHRFFVNGNGTVHNATGSYLTISSDERLKYDIKDANTQWDDIKQLKFRNFKKHDTDGLVHLGVIAQEAEKICPKLVIERNPLDTEVAHNSEFGTLYTKDDVETQDVLYTKDDQDVKDGKTNVGDVKTEAQKNIGDVKEVKSKVKVFKDSILFWKTAKALQEAMARIETLEAEVKALKEA